MDTLEMGDRPADEDAGPATDGGPRATADELAARLAREQYREMGLPLLEPDAQVAPYLAQDERLLSFRQGASLVRIDEAGQAAVRDEGPLYVTDHRLLHLGGQVASIALAEITELAMAEDRILVTLAGVRGVMLDVAEPRQFRVLIAAAKSATRG